MDRTRRTATSKADKFAKFRAARAGQKRSDQYKEEDDDDLYVEVDEEAYKTVVRGRLQQDDFIEDDDGGGYADNGMDDWEEEQRRELEMKAEEDERKKKKKAAIKATSSSKATKKRKETVSDDDEDESNRPGAADYYRPQVAPEQEDSFMSSIFSTMDTPALSTKSKAPKPKTKRTIPAAAPRKRKPSPSFDNSSDVEIPPLGRAGPSQPKPNDLHGDGSDHYNTSDGGNEPLTRQPKRPRLDSSDMEGSGVTGKVANLKVEEDDDDAEFGAEILDLDGVDLRMLDGTSVKDIKPKPVAKKEEEEDDVPAWLSLHSSLLANTATLPSSEADDVFLAPATTTAQLAKKSTVEALEPDGSLHMFWIDYLEMQGKLFLTGKVLDKGPDGKGTKYVSCCLAIGGLQRNVFVLPRERVEENGYVTDVAPDRDDVYDDFNIMRKQTKIRGFAAKWVKRSYAFGDGIPDGESDWMKVVYDFTDPMLPQGLSSPNIAAILGTNTSAFELFVLKRKIMGPCWLHIKNPQVSTSNAISWCKLEVSVNDPKNVNPFDDSKEGIPREVPPLTVMSLTLRSVVNHKLNQQEVVCASSRIWENARIDDPTPPEKSPSTSHTIVRPLGKFPTGFETRARAEKSKIIPAQSEKALLGSLLALIQRYDPDVLVGHEFLGIQLDILLHRLKELKVEHWSRIGRFRRSTQPAIGRQGTNAKFLMGRLVCDLTSDGAKGMITSTTWSLTEMCLTQLKLLREDIDLDDTPVYLDGTVRSPDKMLRFVKHCETDAFFQMAIAAKVQILPLTRQLTNLAGNSWPRTLTGGRSERNEYILLHEFHRLKYICPDKSWGKKETAAATKAEAEEIEGDAPVETTSKKSKSGKGAKDKYKGGLVFEPKRGLWDKFVLVMDFNSLYPSIIQEYNIDFTTVVRVENEDEDIPEVPSPELKQGVLPRLIATLVNRRKQVKNNMKDRSATPSQLLQYDIKQKALKLTANSMYGCLGFAHSRFYARPLAALTTFKGREILTSTKELAESINLDVVYGDTDSVFINSNVTDLAEALKIANQFKKLVNERYKLLEIDLDGIFQRLLLLQKKKYAALKVDDGGKTSTEIKGLDVKRREFCVLSKNVSNYVLDRILSGDPTEVVIEGIHEYLTTMGEKIRAGGIPLEEYIINKRLSKSPKDYPDAKSQPHVQVALRLMEKGASARGGDVIPYIFCLGDDGQSSKSGQADRARHPDEIKRSNGVLKIDYEYYLSTQLLPPISRICEEIEGTDRARLAECLGLNPEQYVSFIPAVSQERQLGSLGTQIPDRERFKETDPFLVVCYACSQTTAFTRLGEVESEIHILRETGFTCSTCERPIALASIAVQLENKIRGHISKYYEGWVKCDEHTCEMRTQMMSVHGKKCLRRGCRGVVTFEYSDSELYTQLLAYASLFDVEKRASFLNSSNTIAKKSELLKALETNQFAMHGLSDVVEKYLEQCGRRWVELGSLFSFMTL